MAAPKKIEPDKSIALVVISLAVLLVFLPNFNSEFLLDDNVLIKNNPFIRQLESVTTYLAQEDGILDREDWDEDFHTRYYRPLINLTYHIDYRLWGLNPAGFYLTNWLLHLLTALLLFWLLLRFTGNVWAVFLTVLLFSLHPVQTESVSWISSRNNILATLFSLACFAAYITVREKRAPIWMLPALVFFLLAVFSKEFGVMVLPICFVYDVVFQKRSLRPDKSWLIYLPFALVLGLYLMARSQVTGSLLDAPETVPFIQRLLYAPYLVMYNLGLIFIPIGLHNFLVDYPAEWMAIYAMGGLAGLALIGSLAWRYRQEKHLVFGIVAFLMGLFPVLNIIPTSAVTLITMRWLYFPLAFLAFAVGPTIGRNLSKLRFGVLLAVAVLLGSYSYYLNREHWHDERSFFTREVLKFNNHLYAGAYAKILHQNGESHLAEKYFQLGISAFPSLVENYIDYTAMLIDLHRPREALAVSSLGLKYQASRQNKGLLQNNRGTAWTRLGKPGAAIAAFESAVRQSPRNVDFISNLGSACGLTGDYPRSVQVFMEGLQIAPESIGIRKNLAQSYIYMAEHEKAIQTLEAIPAATRVQSPGIAGLLERARRLSRQEGGNLTPKESHD